MAIADKLLSDGAVRMVGDEAEVTEPFRTLFAALDIDLEALDGGGKRLMCRPCLDWSERHAAVPLYQRVSTFDELLALDDEGLCAIIKPVAHYNRKTVNLKAMCRQIIEEHGGEIPGDRESLLKLKGVGRKVADLMMNHLFSEDSIAVDTHVLRVLCRLEIVDDITAEQAADTINAISPARYKRHAHEWLIQLGMQVCQARPPNCPSYVVSHLCPTGKRRIARRTQ